MTNEMSKIYQHKLKAMLLIQNKVLSCSTLKDLLITAEKHLNVLMGTELAVIYFTGEGTIYRYNENA